MEQKKIETTSEGVSLVDILRLFRGKLKIMICVALIVAILGAVAGVFIAESNAVYEADITLYLVPAEESQILINLLKSDSFAEKLLLDENGLPPEDECDPTDYQNALAAVQAENAAREKNYKLASKLTAFPYDFDNIERQYNILTSERSRITELLKTYKSSQDAIGSTEEHQAKIAEYEQKLEEAEAAWKKYKTEVYDPAVEESLQLEEDYFHAKNELNAARRKSSEMLEKVLAPWRNKADVRSLINTIQNSVTYTHATRATTTTSSSSSTGKNENLISAFLVIHVEISQDQELANQIVDKIRTRTPAFVEKELERLTGSTTARCTLMSTFAEAKPLSSSSLVKNAVVFGAVGAVAGIVVYCAVIITKGLLPKDLFPKKEKKTKKNKKVAE